ncbi:uncharacterized protein LOC129569530 [Sitodiplosis mosellana]|uniref:uncharacterized protein LOC129569530 n=1 Tax=Sitodiplosis mosellana TaxID=263140 RepID=UPI002443843A|nr:uncharacterized protein LOC129569530 [Sitodiplosis mosellana]
MAIIKSLSFIVFLAIMPSFNVAHTHDCYYDEPTEHVEYICDGPIGEHFNQRTYKILYCHNYDSEIHRSAIKSLGFRNCLISEMTSTSVNLWDFDSLRVLNISYFGFKTLPDYLLRDNIQLERFIVSHNRLTEVPVILFDTTPEITEVDFSFNEFNQIYPLLFDNTRKLRVANFSFNMIDMVKAPAFSNLRELETLDLSSNNIDAVNSDLFAYNKKLKTLNLNDNQVKRLDCEFLATLAENDALDIFINTLEEVQTTCDSGEKHFDLDIVVSPKESSTRLHVSDGQFKWIFSEIEFIKLRRLSLSNGQIKSSIEIIDDDINIDESNLIMWQLNAIEYLLAFMVLILIFVCVFFIAATCSRNRNYNKNLSIFSVEQSLMRNDNNQYQKIKSQQFC